MSSLKSFALWMGLVTCGLLPLGACTNTPWAANLERSLAADPLLKESPGLVEPSATPIASPGDAVVQIPAGFPGEIPRYPNATLVAAPQSSAEQAQPTQTQWATADSSAQVRQFYQDKLKTDGWQLGSANADSGAIVASRDNLQVTVETPANPSTTANAPADALGQTGTSGKTEFTLSYQFTDSSAQLPNPTSSSPASSPSPQTSASSLPQPGDANFVGPLPPATWAASSPQAQPNAEQSPRSTTPETFSDLNQAPPEIQPYIVDLAKLGALPLRSPSSSGNSTSGNSTSGNSAFKPNQAITRREYARWLVTANNQIYANQTSRQVRLGTTTDRPAFSDISSSDQDFGVIQGLANAGLITSALSGDGSPVKFRPDAPLTREEMILWKVPVDIRRSLPNANLEALQQTWGFQDAAKIDPKAQRAVIADYQNGDLANIRRAFGYTTLFQPKKTVTRAEAAAALWFFGSQDDGLSAKDALETAAPEQPIGG
ncbi:MAG: S-layer homology domain-containing protein [Oscillatoriophycideae cyanobacterium NC_groundwater_1537_Pr4_S-0.65um_50_18]|nr:S-layer homology domain-containing protein [Oscillatoriophycideae cyanobacterium NC_groundwater_1537_Pr4_S-0.65um_50_18]